MASPFLEFYAESPRVAENSFRRARPNKQAPPSFASVRHQLPEPFWDKHSDAIRCYWKAWELAFGNLQRVTPTNGFIEPFIVSSRRLCVFCAPLTASWSRSAGQRIQQLPFHVGQCVYAALLPVRPRGFRLSTNGKGARVLAYVVPCGS